MLKGKISKIHVCGNLWWNKINVFHIFKFIGQEKSLFNLQEKIASVYGPLCRIWAALEMEKESMVVSGENLNEEHPSAEISRLLDQGLILLEQSVNNCTYIRRFNIIMALLNDKKKVETVIKENSLAFIDKSISNALFGLKYEETVAKSLPSKSRSKQGRN